MFKNFGYREQSAPGLTGRWTEKNPVVSQRRGRVEFKHKNIVSTMMVSKTLGVTAQAVRRIVSEFCG